MVIKTKNRKIELTSSKKFARKKDASSNMTTAAKALLASGNKKLSPFQLKVLAALCQVPKGKVTTYKYLSDSVGCGSSQAVGQALKRNPYAPTVPCHRVIQSDLTMGGFGGTRSGTKIDKKIALLESEGVVFCQGSGGDVKVDSTCIYKFDD